MDNNEKKTMRVAQILGKMDGGGVEQVVMNYYSHIDREKVQFDFFVFMNSKHIPAEQIKQMGGGLYLLCGFRMPFRYLKTLTKLLKENEYDIVHCHLSTRSFLPLLAAKRAGVPVRIVHNHSTSGGWQEFIRNTAKALFKPFAKIHATEYFACSERAARWMYGSRPVCAIDDANAPKNCVRLLRNAIEPERFAFSAEKRAAIRKEFKIPSNALVFLHVGRFSPPKNQQYLVGVFSEIVKVHKNARLIMVGEGKDMGVVQAMLIRAGVRPLAIFPGQRADVDAFYSAADCFFLPSNYEGLPVVGVEAQSAGLYCIFSDKVTPEAKLTDSVQFLPLSLSDKDWAFAAINCAKLRNDRAAEQTAKAGYDIREEAKKLMDYYISKAAEKGK